MNDRYVLDVLSTFELADCHDSIFWRVRDDEVRFFVIVNDVFWWATADAEEILAEDLPLLRDCLVRLEGIDKSYYLAEYFAARKRGMRPQIPVMEKLEPDIAKLFNECGPERTRADCG